jgi:LPXTG-motif cell wall-anchored protein
MSQARVLTPAAGAAASLPLTGSGTLGMVLLGAGALASGVLLMRAARNRRSDDNNSK